MGMPKLQPVVVLLSLSLLGACGSVPTAPDAVTQGYIVQLPAAPLVSYTGGVAGLAPTSPQATGASLDVNSQASQAYLAYLKTQQAELVAAMAEALGHPVTPGYRYYYSMDGFAVRLTSAEAARVAKLPGVASVRSDQAYHTLAPDAVPSAQPR